jgi:hypothetical protein
LAQTFAIASSGSDLVLLDSLFFLGRAEQPTPTGIASRHPVLSNLPSGPGPFLLDRRCATSCVFTVPGNLSRRFPRYCRLSVDSLMGTFHSLVKAGNLWSCGLSTTGRRPRSHRSLAKHFPLTRADWSALGNRLRTRPGRSEPEPDSTSSAGERAGQNTSDPKRLT